MYERFDKKIFALRHRYLCGISAGAAAIPVAFYFILLTTAVVTSAIYCAKHGIDFLFTLMAPIAFLFTMIYSGGFRATNIILLFVYLIAGIFGQFLGDLAFGDE